MAAGFGEGASEVKAAIAVAGADFEDGLEFVFDDEVG